MWSLLKFHLVIKLSIATLHKDTLIFPAIIWKIISFQDFVGLAIGCSGLKRFLGEISWKRRFVLILAFEEKKRAQFS